MPDKNEKHLELLKDIQKSELLTALIQQINKDLNLSGIGYRLDLKIDPTMLLAELTKIIFILLNNDSQKLQNFMYRVDVPENNYVEIEDFIIRSKKISVIILKKECQKIWFRT